MSSFIVMQGETYQEDKQRGIIWSPQRDKAGTIPHSYRRMQEVKTGDYFFHYVKGYIVAISTVKEGCREGKDPRGSNLSGQDGYLVATEYRELEVPLDISRCIEDFIPFLPLKYAAFQQDGSGSPGFLYPCNEELAIALLERISQLNVYVLEEEQMEFAIEVVKNTEHNPLVLLIDEILLAAKTKMERGEQKFRKRLQPLWNGKCPLCGIGIDALLKASRAKPWKDSTDMERIDPFNGLLLCANHDAMYTNGLIALDGQGRVHISGQIAEDEYAVYGLQSRMKVSIYPENKPYVKWHKRHVFKR